MNSIYQIEKLLEYFANQQDIATEDIFRFYQQNETGVKRSAVIRRIVVLEKNRKIERLSKGVYRLGQTKNYVPILEKELMALYRKLQKKFPLINFCVWNTKQFNELMLHQPAQFLSVIETEKDSSEYVFHFLKQAYKEVYLNPTKAEIEKYVSLAKNGIVVKNLISETPIQQIDLTPTITIEKILVDVFCEPYLFAAQQGTELETIFKTAFEKYTINTSKLLRYANRRKRKKEIVELIQYLNLTQFEPND